MMFLCRYVGFQSEDHVQIHLSGCLLFHQQDTILHLHLHKLAQSKPSNVPFVQIWNNEKLLLDERIKVSLFASVDNDLVPTTA